jgi:hypothetical protein
MRVNVFRKIRRIVPALIALAGFALSLQSARGQDAPVAQTTGGTRTTVIVFPHQPMPDDEWAALFEEVQRTAHAEKIEGAGDVEFVRGDTMRPGLSVERDMVVYLHGNCNLEPLPRRSGYSERLGWVIRENGGRENGRIDPYIHVDCTRIGQVLGAQAQGLDKQARDRMMAGAVARVMVHEWIHVARQSAEHGRNGITKASFGVADLLGEPETRVARR